MKVECTDLERILHDDNPEELRALALHASECPACGAELRVWNEMSAAAPALRKSWASPHLWPRIHQALAEESQTAVARGGSLGGLFPRWLADWRAAAAVLALMLVSAGATYLLLRGLPPRNAGDQVVKEMQEKKLEMEETRLLTEQALREIEQSEAAYTASIDKLAKLAQPKVQQAATPLMLSYREKLLVLDSAIAELRAQAEQNRFHAHLRGEMLSLYQEKQRTLEAVIREE